MASELVQRQASLVIANGESRSNLADGGRLVACAAVATCDQQHKSRDQAGECPHPPIIAK